MLFIVPSPIGNLGDLSFRAVEILNRCDGVLAEDTRTSSILLKRYAIQKPLYPYHQHNEHQIIETIIQQLQNGRTLSLLTDAGTPAISDPGFLLVRSCIQHGIKIECLPGATAFVPALVLSGLPTNRFVFEGFLPLKKGRRTLLTALANETRTIIFYESPNRLVKTLQECASAFGSHRLCSVSRELTKIFEETIRGSLSEVCSYFQNKTTIKGELVVVVKGCDN